jgi:uncharacterized membrane protein
MQLVIERSNSHAASLILKTVAVAWKTSLVHCGQWSPADAIYMPDLVELLQRFRTLAVRFLTDEIKLVPSGVPLSLKKSGGHLHGIECYTSQCLRAAVIPQVVRYISDLRVGITEYVDYVATAYSKTTMQRFLQFVMQRAAAMTSAQSKADFKIKQHVIPIRNCNTIELLEAAVIIAESQDSALLFKSEVIAAVTDLHWSLYGRADHISGLLMYILLLTVFTAVLVMYDTWYTSAKLWQYVLGWTLQGIKTVIIGFNFGRQDFRNLMHHKLAAVRMWDAWNTMGVTAYFLTFISALLPICSNKVPYDGKVVNILDAIAAVLLWFKLLHYMRPYKATGVLVSMIFKILMKIRAFILVLTVVVIGFSSAFYTILRFDSPQTSLNFSSPDWL